MKGFIKLRKNDVPFLLSLSAIATVNAYGEDQTRIVLLVTDKSGNPEVIFFSHPFAEVEKLMEAATR